MKRNKTYEKNLKVLEKINPEVAHWIDTEPDVDWIEEIQSKNGDMNLLIKDGSSFHNAYDMDNPSKIAEDTAEGMNLYKENASIVVGMGLGYLAKAILNKMEKRHKLIVVEPIAHIARLALSNIDFSKELKDSKLILVLAGEEEVSLALHIVGESYIIEDWSFTINQYTKGRPDEYSKVTSQAQEVLNQLMCNQGTIAGDAGGIIADNDIACLPWVIRHRGVVELKDMFKDKPAILVSTGPSLAKNIHHLIGLEDKAVIICVGQAIRVLLAYGIKPDFACTVDFGEVNIVHFKGLMDCNIPLVTINRAYAPLLKEWQGPKFVVGTPVPGHEEMAAGILQEKGFIDAGGSVAHLSFGLAKQLGCSPITFVGQDLALGATSHIPQADAMGDIVVDPNGIIGWTMKDQRCHLSKEDMISMGQVCNVPGYYGGMVPTNAGLLSFKTVFDKMCQTTENKVINATEGGCHIEYTERMLLKDVIEKYHAETIDKSKLRSLLTYADDGDELVSKVIPLLENDIEDLEIIMKTTKKGLNACDDLEKLVDQKNYEKLLTKKQAKLIEKAVKKTIAQPIESIDEKNEYFYTYLLERLKQGKIRNLVKASFQNNVESQKAREVCTKNPLVKVAIYGATRQIWSRRLKVNETLLHFLKNKKDALTRIKRNRLILNAAQNAAESLEKSYTKTLELLKEYDKTKDNDLLCQFKEEEINLDDAEEYFEKGNWAHPLLDSAKVGEKDFYDCNGSTKAEKIYKKANKMKEEAIKKAKEAEKNNYKENKKLLKYNSLLEQSKDIGRKGKEPKDFEQALELLKEAVELMPDREEARWGLATALHHTKRLKESINEYRKLVDDFPEELSYKFEMGQVLLTDGDTDEGFKVIGEVMKETNQFDYFLVRIGQIYEVAELWPEAITAYEDYLKIFANDFNTWKRLGDCYRKTGYDQTAKEHYNKALEIKPDFEEVKELLKGELNE